MRRRHTNRFSVGGLLALTTVAAFFALVIVRQVRLETELDEIGTRMRVIETEIANEKLRREKAEIQKQLDSTPHVQPRRANGQL
jgi:hypothetical protein